MSDPHGSSVIAPQLPGEAGSGGTVQQPIIETFFSPAFGMCIDRYGTPWMVTVDQPMTA